MGNIVQCCQILANYFKCKDALMQNQPEVSPLLSAEESDCDSLNLDDDLLTVSTGATNPTLERENFLFPDIILSSGLGGDVTLVEPMVCLLVSEEEERRVDEPGCRLQKRRNEGRGRECSEVETQTGAETHISTGVQTQTESQARTEILMHHHETVEREGNTPTSTGDRNKVVVDVKEEHKILEQVLLEAQTDTQTSKERHADIDPATWSDIDILVESEKREKLTGGSKLSFGDTVQETDRGELDENHISKDPTATSAEHTFQTEQNREFMPEFDTDEEGIFEMQQDTNFTWTEHRTLRTQVSVRDAEGNRESECASVMSTGHKGKQKTPAEDSQRSNRPIDYSVDNTDGARDADQVGRVTVPSGQTVNGKDSDVTHTKRNDDPSEELTDQTAKQSGLNADRIQCRENLHPLKRGEDDNRTGAQQLLDVETSLVQADEEEGGAAMKEMTLLWVDRLFQASHVKARPSRVERSPEDDTADQTDVDGSKLLDIREIVDLQGTDFTVRIQPPGSEGFELQVSGRLLVAELHQVLMEHEASCHRTCFSLRLGGTTLDSLTKLRSVRGVRDGAPIKVVEESYSVLDARLHLKHVHHLLRSLHLADANDGANCSSLSYLTFYTGGEKEREGVGNELASDFKPPEYLLPGCKDRPLTPLQPPREDREPLQCLRVLTMSSWNPPPGNRKMHGDLMYLNVLTMEDRELNITSSTRGFYLNQSTAFNFNPKPAVPKILCHSLVELLSQVSAAFRKNFSALLKKRVQLHRYERIATPFQVFTWTARQGDHTLGCVGAEETHSTRTGHDEHTAGKSRDWNEELQGCRELGRSSLQERLHRERSIFKTNSDFVEAATRGAVAVIDGNVMPINPGEAAHMHMFICNNLFFSLGFDVAEHYRPLGGNPAAHAAAVCDLRGVQAYSSVDIEGLHTLGTAVVDYRGIRVIAQTIIPGILEKNQEQLVIYGSNDYGKTVSTHPRILELLDKTTKPLRIQRHQVLDHHNSPVELCSGIETKGILGNDGRPYILDLLRTSPPDLNFQFSETEESSTVVPKECKSFGYPRQHCHSLASLRPELTEAFIQHRYTLYVTMVSQGLIRLEEQQKSMEQSEEQMSEPRARDKATAAVYMGVEKGNVIMNACKAVGSVSDSCFDICFNPNVCSPGARFPSECAAEVQRLLLWDVAAFLLSNQIPAVLRDCLNRAAVPMDGGTLTSVLHRGGVNVRYLGTLLRVLDGMEERGRLSHIHRICVSEVITRSAKHIFRTYLQDVEPAAYSAAISHFLNCLLSSSSCFPDSCSDELLSRRRGRRRRGHGSRLAVIPDGVWARLTPSELWVRIRAEAQDYYHYTIDSESMDDVIEKHGLQRISLLREISIKTGIQVRLRDYAFESRHRPAFGEEDVVNVFPVVKHLTPTGTDAARLVQHAQVAVQQGLLKDAYDLISQALTLYSSVCGVLHEDVCACLRLLGRLSYVLEQRADAVSRQEKAVMISERVQGIDHPQTIQDYTDLALYCFAGGRLPTSLQLLYRARYLTLLVTGEDHPHVALLDSMLGLVLHGLMEHELSLKFLQNALNLTSKYHGATSVKHAHSHHLLATVYESKGEFQSALQHEKEAYGIYENQTGENRDSAKESSEYLKSLTEQAVSLQKAINHIYSITPGACVLPPKLSTPSVPAILQRLNRICGITLIPTVEPRNSPS